MTDDELMRLVGPPAVSDELAGDPRGRESSEGTALTDEQLQALMGGTTPTPPTPEVTSDEAKLVETQRKIDAQERAMRARGWAVPKEPPHVDPDSLPPGATADYDGAVHLPENRTSENPEGTTDARPPAGALPREDGRPRYSEFNPPDSEGNRADWSPPTEAPPGLRVARDPVTGRPTPGIYTKDNGDPVPVYLTGDPERDRQLREFAQAREDRMREGPRERYVDTTGVDAVHTGPYGMTPSDVGRLGRTMTGGPTVPPPTPGVNGSVRTGVTPASPAGAPQTTVGPPRGPVDAIGDPSPSIASGPQAPGPSSPSQMPAVVPPIEVPDNVPILPTDSPLEKVNKEQLNAQLGEERQARALQGIGDRKQLELDHVAQVRQQAAEEQAARQAQFQQDVRDNASRRDQQIAELRAHTVDPRRLMNQMSAWDVANIGSLAALNAGAGGEAAANYLTNVVNADNAFQQARYANDQHALSYLVGQQDEGRSDQQVRMMAAKEALADSLELEASRMEAGTVKQNTALAVEKMRSDLRKEKDSLAIHEESMLVQQARANKLGGGGGGGGNGSMANLDAYRNRWGITDKNQKRIFVLDSADLDTPPLVSPTEPSEEFRNRFDTTQNGFANAYRLLDRVQYSMSKHNSAKDLSQFLQTEEGARITADISQSAPFLAATEGSKVNAATLKIFNDMAAMTPGQLASYLNQSANLSHLREAMHNIQDTHDQHLASFAHTNVSQLRQTYADKLQLRGLGNDDRAEIDGAGRAPPADPGSSDPRVVDAAIDKAGEDAPARAKERDRVTANKARVNEWKESLKGDSPSFGLKSPAPVDYQGKDSDGGAPAYAKLATAVLAYRASEGRFQGDSDPYNVVPSLDSNRRQVDDKLAEFLASRPDVALRYFKDDDFSPPLTSQKVYGQRILKQVLLKALDGKGRDWRNTMVGNIIRDGGG